MTSHIVRPRRSSPGGFGDVVSEAVRSHGPFTADRAASNCAASQASWREIEKVAESEGETINTSGSRRFFETPAAYDAGRIFDFPIRGNQWRRGRPA